MLDLVRWLLLRKGGLPLGGVLMGFQVADLTVLWKPPFWSLVAPSATSPESGTRASNRPAE